MKIVNTTFIFALLAINNLYSMDFCPSWLMPQKAQPVEQLVNKQQAVDLKFTLILEWGNKLQRDIEQYRNNITKYDRALQGIKARTIYTPRDSEKIVFSSNVTNNSYPVTLITWNTREKCYELLDQALVEKEKCDTQLRILKRERMWPAGRADASRA